MRRRTPGDQEARRQGRVPKAVSESSWRVDRVNTELVGRDRPAAPWLAVDRCSAQGILCRNWAAGFPPLCPLIVTIAKLGSAMKRDAHHPWAGRRHDRAASRQARFAREFTLPPHRSWADSMALPSPARRVRDEARRGAEREPRCAYLPAERELRCAKMPADWRRHDCGCALCRRIGGRHDCAGLPVGA